MCIRDRDINALEQMVHLDIDAEQPGQLSLILDEIGGRAQHPLLGAAHIVHHKWLGEKAAAANQLEGVIGHATVSYTHLVEVHRIGARGDDGVESVAHGAVVLQLKFKICLQLALVDAGAHVPQNALNPQARDADGLFDLGDFPLVFKAAQVVNGAGDVVDVYKRQILCRRILRGWESGVAEEPAWLYYSL